MSGIDIVKTTSSILDLQACVFFPLFILNIFLAKRCFWYNGDKVLRHHELAPVEQRDGDGGGKRVGPHLRVPHLPTYPWIINCRFDLSSCRRHWPGKLWFLKLKLDLISTSYFVTYDSYRYKIFPLKNGETSYSETTIEPVYRSNTEVYAGESIALELDVTFPPWSGSNPINFTFQPQTLVFATKQNKSIVKSFSQLSSSGYYHFWRMCSVEIIDVSDDLICLNHGLTEYLESYAAFRKSYTKSAIPYLQQWWVTGLKKLSHPKLWFFSGLKMWALYKLMLFVQPSYMQRGRTDFGREPFLRTYQAKIHSSKVHRKITKIDSYNSSM